MIGRITNVVSLALELTFISFEVYIIISQSMYILHKGVGKNTAHGL